MEQLEGRNPVLEALQAGQDLNKVLIAKGTSGGAIDRIISLCRRRQVTVQFVDRQVLEKMSVTGRHQGVVAELAAFAYAQLETVLDRARERQEALLLVMLDGVEDPHNLGSVIRTAEAAGAHGVIIPKHRAVGLTPAVARASAGAIAHLPVVRVTNLVQCCAQLKEAGAWVVGAEADAEQLAYQSRLDGPLVLVLGGEGKGISRLLREHCDLLVRFPLLGQVNSLNVSVSAALLLYEVVRQRKVMSPNLA
ncbi:MAG: 23S rRNA (guanosine(2251)-2'-O)-methyltransferase RlmB [Bacillota bacterium]|jgi:23S rRNA (guanosine2251-2'-O)-methyltransferase